MCQHTRIAMTSLNICSYWDPYKRCVAQSEYTHDLAWRLQRVKGTDLLPSDNDYV